jgi:cytochrome c553
MSRMSSASKPIPLLPACIFAGVVCATLAGTAQAGANDDAGKSKAEASCAACHGPEGNKPVTPETPRLAGQQYDYLVQALTQYRNGARNNAIMSAMAKPLTEKEIRDLAEYYANQQGLTSSKPSLSARNPSSS